MLNVKFKIKMHCLIRFLHLYTGAFKLHTEILKLQEGFCCPFLYIFLVEYYSLFTALSEIKSSHLSDCTQGSDR